MPLTLALSLTEVNWMVTLPALSAVAANCSTTAMSLPPAAAEVGVGGERTGGGAARVEGQGQAGGRLGRGGHFGGPGAFAAADGGHLVVIGRAAGQAGVGEGVRRDAGPVRRAALTAGIR